MSAERPRRRIARAVAMIAGLVVITIAGVAAWLWLPWRTVDGLAVDAVRANPASGGRLAIDFSVPVDVETTRRHYGIGFMTARLFACGDPDRSRRHVITQNAGYLPDRGRVTRLPPAGGRVRYRAVFDDRLDGRDDNGRGEDVTPARRRTALFRAGGQQHVLGHDPLRHHRPAALSLSHGPGRPARLSCRHSPGDRA